MASVTPSQALQTLKTNFNLQELELLAFSIGIPYEDLGGSGKSGKALAMVQYSQRHGKFDQLVEEMNAPRDENATLTPPADAPTGNVTYNIEIGSISDSTGFAFGQNASTTTNTKNTYDMSGNFSGAMLNINSSLENVTQTIGTLPTANETTKAELQQLVTQLQEMLQQVPPAKEEDAEVVAELTKTLLDTANKKKPNKPLLKITGDGLKQAAENLAAIVPDVVKIAGAIVAGVLAL